MENFRQFFFGKNVLLTGFSGYIGSHLGMILKEAGASVYGVSRQSSSSIYENCDISNEVISCDLRNYEKVKLVFDRTKPEIVFHLAAIADVNYARENSYEALDTNISSTLNILESCRICETVSTMIIVSTKRSQIKDNSFPCKDPYSVSKSCVNLISQSYFHTHFKTSGKKLLIFSLSNVMGAGDLQFKRLIPKCIYRWRKGDRIVLNVTGLRLTFVHMYDVVFGMLSYAKLLSEGKNDNTTINGKIVYFVPDKSEKIEKIVSDLGKLWDAEKSFEELVDIEQGAKNIDKIEKHEISNEKEEMNVDTLISFKKSLQLTVEWYKQYFSKKSVKDITFSQIQEIQTLYSSRN